MQKISVMDVDNNKETPSKKPLRYHETLNAFCDVIAEYYYECEIDVYRTAVCNPPTDFDITPTRRRHIGTQGSELPFIYTQEEVDLMNDDEKKVEVGHDAVSVHCTEEKAIMEARRAAASFAKTHTEEETTAYKNKQRGIFLVKLHVTPEHALVSKKFHKSTGHGGLLLREGVTINDILDKDYEIKEFKYDENEDKQ